MSGDSPAPRAGLAVLGYTAARLGLFAVCVILGDLAGLRGALLLVAALLVSGVLSYFALDRPRRRMAAALEVAVTRSRHTLAARTEAEDAYVDALEPPPDAPGQPPFHPPGG